MRIGLPARTERFGAVRIHEVQSVYELDSGSASSSPAEDLAYQWQVIRHIPPAAISEIEQRMAIVVPCRNERLKVLDGVLSGIPHDCLIILVSNSDRDPVDRFAMEVETLERFCQFAERSAVVVHQRDSGLAEALSEAGMSELIDDDGHVRNGKGEGMLIGMAVARLAGMKYVGFIDADNFVPGAVHEYVKCFAAGLHLGQSDYSMVRISWHSKPKIQGDRLMFNRWGRSSEVTNRFLNLFLSHYSGFGTDTVVTGNAGEHAMSLELAEKLRFATGYSVESNEYVNMFELFGGVMTCPYPEVLPGGVDVFQIETRNPHFHENKGRDHVEAMRTQSINVLYHSPICPPGVRDEILDFLEREGQLEDGEVPATGPIYPPLDQMDFEAFLDVLAAKSDTFSQIRRVIPLRVHFDSPIPVPTEPEMYTDISSISPFWSDQDAPK